MGDNTIELLSIADVINVVAKRYDISVALLRGNSRRRHLIEPRHLAMWLAHHLLGKPSTEIGKAFGGRDHTTVLSALNNIHRWTGGRNPDTVWLDLCNPQPCGSLSRGAASSRPLHS